jgi:rubrerythrin
MAKKKTTYYTLDKISNPGFTLSTTHLEVIKNHLKPYICDICLGLEPDPDMPNDFTINQKKLRKLEKKLRREYKKDIDDRDQKKIDKLNKEIIGMYMCTACGAEFTMEEKKQ